MEVIILIVMMILAQKQFLKWQRMLLLLKGEAYGTDALILTAGDNGFFGNLTFSSDSDLVIPDNSGTALEIKASSGNFMIFDSTYK